MNRVSGKQSDEKWIDYPLQGTRFDVPTDEILELDDLDRHDYIIEVLKALAKSIESDEMALKNRINFKKEIQDYRTLLRRPADSYLLTDDKTFTQNLLASKSPGSTHTTRSRHNMWKMVTKQGSLEEIIRNQEESLVRRIEKLFDSKIEGKAQFRKDGALDTIYSHLQMNFSVGAAFPPFHAKFFADKFLPTTGECLVVDPCAGWGGRLLGTLCVKRKDKVTYVGIDPETRNQEAYETLQGLYNKYLKKESKSERSSQIYYEKFEDWIDTDDAAQYFGKTDLVITSPPYFNAELYNSENENQSANSFKTYPEWREKFYRKLVQGAFDLLKPGGTFVLNIANVSSAEYLEKDARVLAKEVGFKGAGFFKLAMSVMTGTSGSVRHSVVVEGAKFKIEPCFVFEKSTAPVKRSIARTKKTAIVKTEIIKKAKLPPKRKTVPWEAIKQHYKSYDATCSDSFKRIKQKDKAKFIFLNGKPVAGFVLNQRSSAGHECLYKGKSRSVPSIAYFKGDTEVTKFAVFDADAKKVIVETLAGLKRPCIVEVNASSNTEIAILQSAGFEFADASVNSFGDIYHMYIDKAHVKERLLPVESAERINLKRLSNLDFSALATKIAKRLERLENSLEFAVHPSNYNINETWSAVALRGYLPAPEFIESLEENSAYQNKHNEKWLKLFKKSQHGLQNTSLMAQFPEVQKILDAIVPQSAKNGNSAFKRVRFMKLAPKEGELERHTDLTDTSLGIEEGRTIRLHVAIKTNPSVKVTSWGLDNQESVKHLKQGELWYLNIRCPHKVINAGKTERIHLVIDVVSNESIRSLITGPTSKTLKPVISKSEVTKDADYYLKLVRGWKDPNPKPVIENWEGFQVVRDDLLAHGSKERFIDFMVKTAKETEFVFGASNKVGWGAISLSAVCRKYGKKAVFFMAKTANPTWHQQEVLRLGGRIEWVANGMLNVTQARARHYADKNPQKRRLLPIGLEDETVLASIIKVAQGLKIAPKEVWTVASSGTLSRGLQLAFPKAKFFAVQTGHSLTAESAGRAEVLVSPYKFDKSVKDSDAPPYPSEAFYDAKLWQFCRKQGAKGALIWNVAG